MQTAIAVWGAVLATVLCVRELITWRRERIKLQVNLALPSQALSTDADDADQRLVRTEDDRGLPRGVFLLVSAANAGGSPVQIVSVYFEGEKYEHQVVPTGLPIVLEPNTGVDLRLQPEWMVSEAIGPKSVGVLDALGRRYPVSPELVEPVVAAARALPHRVRAYRRKEGVDERLDQTVSAFQTFDPVRLIRLPHGPDPDSANSTTTSAHGPSRRRPASASGRRRRPSG